MEADAEIVKGSRLAGVLALLLGRAVECRCDRRRVSSGEGRRVVEWRACMAAEGGADSDETDVVRRREWVQ